VVGGHQSLRRPGVLRTSASTTRQLSKPARLRSARCRSGQPKGVEGVFVVQLRRPRRTAKRGGVFRRRRRTGYQTFSYPTSTVCNTEDHQQMSRCSRAQHSGQILGWNDVLTRCAHRTYQRRHHAHNNAPERSLNGLDLAPQEPHVLRIAAERSLRLSRAR